MEKRGHLDASLLFDWYGELLTERQRRIWRLYWLEDWSLSEISESEGISRAAVYDGLERVKARLGDYDTKLGLVAAGQRRRQALIALREALQALPDSAELRQAWAAYERMAAEEGLSDV